MNMAPSGDAMTIGPPKGFQYGDSMLRLSGTAWAVPTVSWTLEVPVVKKNGISLWQFVVQPAGSAAPGMLPLTSKVPVTPMGAPPDFPERWMVAVPLVDTPLCVAKRLNCKVADKGFTSCPSIIANATCPPFKA